MGKNYSKLFAASALFGVLAIGSCTDQQLIAGTCIAAVDGSQIAVQVTSSRNNANQSALLAAGVTTKLCSDIGAVIGTPVVAPTPVPKA